MTLSDARAQAAALLTVPSTDAWRLRGPSTHLSWAELACHDAPRTPYPDAHRMTRAPLVAETFETIRALLDDRPVRIGSAYRAHAHNQAIGGAQDSMHLYGLALDLYPPRGRTVEALHYAAVLALGQKGGLFAYSWGVHVDRRDLLDRPIARGDYRR